MTRFEVNFSMVVGEVSPPAAIGMRQYAAFFAAQTPTHIESFAPLAQTQTKTQLT